MACVRSDRTRWRHAGSSASRPPRDRATEQNVLFNIGRLAGGLGPVAVATIAAKHGFPTAVSLLALVYLIDLVAMLALIPERRGAAPS